MLKVFNKNIIAIYSLSSAGCIFRKKSIQRERGREKLWSWRLLADSNVCTALTWKLNVKYLLSIKLVWISMLIYVLSVALVYFSIQEQSFIFVVVIFFSQRFAQHNIANKNAVSCQNFVLFLAAVVFYRCSYERAR